MDTPTHQPLSNTSTQGADNNAKPDHGTATPAVQKLFQRAVDGAHDAIDGAAKKVAPVVDGVSNVSQTKDAWIGAARDAIREHPFAAVATALLAGAAYVSLSSRKR